MEPEVAEGPRSWEDARKRSPTQARPCGVEEQELWRSRCAPVCSSQQLTVESLEDDAITSSIVEEDAAAERPKLSRVFEGSVGQIVPPIDHRYGLFKPDQIKVIGLLEWREKPN